MRPEHPSHGPLEPQDIEELLPWYVTGRVSREEARGIEAALKTMPDLADKLAHVQRERDAVARASEAVEPAPPEMLQRLLQQVETTRQRRLPRNEAPGEALGWFKSALARNAVWQSAFVLACVAVVALGFRLYSLPATPDLAASIGTANGALVRVTFQPDAASADIAALLTGLNASVVDGPKPDGTYIVRIPARQPGDVDAAIAALVAHQALVVTAAPGS